MTFTDTQIAALKAPLDSNNVKKPSGRFGPKGDYLEGWHVINELNRIFGFDGWSYRIELMPESRFGRNALNNSNLMRRLRGGWIPTEHVIKTTMAYMAGYDEAYASVVIVRPRTETRNERNDEALRNKAAAMSSDALSSAILAAFPYGTGERPSVANSQFKRMPPPTLMSRGEAMT